MSTNQPNWQPIANLGDANPFEYGGYFVYRDVTGVYDAEVAYWAIDDDCPIEVYRFILEPCTYVAGILSDNPYHPEHPAWFATPESERSKRPQGTTYLSDVAFCMGSTVDELISWFTSRDIRDRAIAYRMVGDYHGFENLDNYPLTMSRFDLVRRYRHDLAYINNPKLRIGYAETSTKRRPKEPTIEVVGEIEIAQCNYLGQDNRNGYVWSTFRDRVTKRYYWQLASDPTTRQELE